MKKKRARFKAYVNKEEYYRLKALGYNGKQISHLMDIGESTLSTHKKKWELEKEGI